MNIFLLNSLSYCLREYKFISFKFILKKHREIYIFAKPLKKSTELLSELLEDRIFFIILMC